MDSAVLTSIVDVLTNDAVFKYFFLASTVISFLCWIATLITNNYSHVINGCFSFLS
jgi:hypothetical protein